MKTNNGDLPAMPQSDKNIQVFSVSRGFSAKECSGLTKREQFAMAAMQGLYADIVNIYENLCGVGEVPTDYLARQAVSAADALLAELERTK